LMYPLHEVETRKVRKVKVGISDDKKYIKSRRFICADCISSLLAPIDVKH